MMAHSARTPMVSEAAYSILVPMVMAGMKMVAKSRTQVLAADTEQTVTQAMALTSRLLLVDSIS